MRNKDYGELTGLRAMRQQPFHHPEHGSRQLVNGLNDFIVVPVPPYVLIHDADCRDFYTIPLDALRSGFGLTPVIRPPVSQKQHDLSGFRSLQQHHTTSPERLVSRRAVKRIMIEVLGCRFPAEVHQDVHVRFPLLPAEFEGSDRNSTQAKQGDMKGVCCGIRHLGEERGRW